MSWYCWDKPNSRKYQGRVWPECQGTETGMKVFCNKFLTPDILVIPSSHQQDSSARIFPLPPNTGWNGRRPSAAHGALLCGQLPGPIWLHLNQFDTLSKYPYSNKKKWIQSKKDESDVSSKANLVFIRAQNGDITGNTWAIPTLPVITLGYTLVPPSTTPWDLIHWCSHKCNILKYGPRRRTAFFFVRNAVAAEVKISHTWLSTLG